MKNLVMDYAKKNKEFDTALNELKKTYETEDVSDEVLADISGQLLGNQDFILNLSTKKPNIFKKMYDKIISIANKITGNSKEKWFIKDLKNKWEEAYRNTANKEPIEKLNDIKYHLSKNALKEVNDALNNPNTDINSMAKLRDVTPEQLVQLGVKNLPMLVRKGHLRENILTSAEAQSKGYSTKGKHYHGLGINTYMNAIDSLDNPIAVYQYTDKGNYSKDNFIVLTQVKDGSNNNIIVPIEINKKGQYNKIELDINRIKTTYGKNNPNYFNNMVKSGDLIEVYNKKRSAKLPIQSGNFNTLSTDNISQSDTKVKSNTSSTKYSMQESKNDTQELNNGSFFYDNQGRRLTKERQYYFKNSKIRDKNGNLLVMYHGSPNEFTVFDKAKAKQSGNYGNGFYFAYDTGYSNQHKGNNGNTYEVYLNIGNPLSIFNKEKNISKKQLQDLVIKIANNEDYGIENFGYDATPESVTNSLYQHDNDFEMLFDLNLVSVGNMVELVKYCNKTIGTNYDGIMAKSEVIAFEPNQIKNVDNTNPTSDADIRYSKQSDKWQEHLEKNYKATGKRTNMANLRKTNSSNTNTSNNTNKAIAPIRKGMKQYQEMGEIVKKDNAPNYVPKIPIAEPKLKTHNTSANASTTSLIILIKTNKH